MSEVETKTSTEYLWNLSSEGRRLTIACFCGWHTKQGVPDRNARSISKRSWRQLSPAAQKIIGRFAETRDISSTASIVGVGIG